MSAHAEQIGELERLCEREWRLIKQLHSGEKVRDPSLMCFTTQLVELDQS